MKKHPDNLYLFRLRISHGKAIRGISKVKAFLDFKKTIQYLEEGVT